MGNPNTDNGPKPGDDEFSNSLFRDSYFVILTFYKIQEAYDGSSYENVSSKIN